MDHLSQLRERFLQYNTNINPTGQRGGGDNSDTESEDDRPYMAEPTATTLSPIRALEEQTRKGIMKSKSKFYNTVMPAAPSNLDQSIVLNTILESDLARIAQVLIDSLMAPNRTHFKTSLLDIYNRNNQDLHVKPEDLDKYRALINTEGLKCIGECLRLLESFNTKTNNQNIDDCQNMIHDVFVTYVYTQYNPKEEI